MHILGKLLLFVNMLIAGGVIFLATQDWAKRQDVTAMALRYFLVLKGLPLEAPPASEPDAIPFPVETGGGFTVETVRPSLLAAYFQGVDGGGPYASAGTQIITQLDEVKRVQGKIDAQLRAASSDVDRLAMLAGRDATVPGLLTPLAETFEERELIRRLATADPQKPGAIEEAAKKAEDLLKRRFDAVLTKPDPKAAGVFADKLKDAVDKLRLNPQDKVSQDEFAAVLLDRALIAARDDGDRRRQIAHLLMFLDPTAGWQKRVAMVVGLRTYQKAAAEQVGHLRDIARSTQRQLEMDQASFIEQYELLKNVALERSTLEFQQTQILAELEKQKAADTEALNQRARQLKDRQASLDAIQLQVAAQLASQAKIEKDLFEVQKQVGQTLRANFTLEEDLEKSELSQTGGR